MNYLKLGKVGEKETKVGKFVEKEKEVGKADEKEKKIAKNNFRQEVSFLLPLLVHWRLIILISCFM